MKKIHKEKYLKLIALFLALVIFAGGLSIPDSKIVVEAASSYEKKACWISCLDFEDIADKSETEFRNNVTAIYNRVLANNMNTVIVHVRPYSDAIYPSSYYPWSTTISSDQTNPGYDPLKIMIEIAHTKGLEFEAWVNPYRVSNSTYRTNLVKKTSFYTKYKSMMIEYTYNGNNCIVLDPASTSAQDLIVNGVAEIVSNYDVDGVHFDDYFYVTGMPQYNSLSQSQKMANVNSLVRKVYSKIKNIDSSVEFGISPAGNIENAKNQGVDMETWLSTSGYVDYLMPQIYWSDEYLIGGKSTTLYTNRVKAWAAMNKNKIPMYVGLGLYNAGGTTSTVDIGWNNSNTNLRDQVTIARANGFSGFALFRYAFLYHPDTQIELTNLKSVTTNVTGISYQAHVQNVGWQNAVNNGMTAGTIGQSKRIEAIKINVNDSAYSGGIMYRTHVENEGWQNWAADGNISGSIGKYQRVEALQIALTGDIAEYYDVYYRVHVQDYGWLSWACNGQIAGTTGKSKRIEAIEIKLVNKGEAAPGNTETPNYLTNVSYRAHVQNIGWQNYVADSALGGTTGQSKRMEAIRINASGMIEGGNVEYSVHVQDYGWQGYVANGATAGTTGKGKRIEAIRIRLTGEKAELYDIYYAVHVQDIGWTQWVCNDEIAGTTGQSKRIEGIMIRIVPKGSSF